MVKKKKKGVRSSKNNFNRNALVLVVVVVVVLIFAFYARGITGNVTSEFDDTYETFQEEGFFANLLSWFEGEKEPTSTKDEFGNLVDGIISDVKNGISDEEVKVNAMSVAGFGSVEAGGVTVLDGGDSCDPDLDLCRDEFICEGGVCGIDGPPIADNDDGSCSSPDDCPNGDICSNGYCLTPSCADDVECVTDFGVGYVCHSELGYCTDCEFDGDCAAGEYCYYGNCFDKEGYGGYCEEDGNCISGRCRCKFGTLPELCPESDPPSCKCNDASDCVNLFDSTDKASDWTCHVSSGNCIKKLEIGETCTLGSQCKSGACDGNYPNKVCVECKLDSHCPSEANPDNNYCRNNVCSECKTDNNCMGNPNGVMCDFGACTPCSDFICTARENVGNLGVPDPYYCLSENSIQCVECRDDFDCDNKPFFTGDICSNINYCEPCENDAECGFGFTCNNDNPRKCVVEVLV
jgi:hypothetical protein